jgi:phosphorylcholine metabolism protein LicD
MRQQSHTQFKDKEVNIAYELLFTVCELLNKENIEYHLEGGTLLGLVRDYKLLPWDHDLDISIPCSETSRLMKALKKLPRKWRISKRYFSKNTEMWNTSDLRLIKVKNRFFYFMPGDHCMDIFIKFTYHDFTYWQAGQFIMKADKSHYQGAEILDYNKHKLRIPLQHEMYLEAKYGNWKTPDKNWHLSREKTITHNPSK